MSNVSYIYSMSPEIRSDGTLSIESNITLMHGGCSVAFKGGVSLNASKQTLAERGFDACMQDAARATAQYAKTTADAVIAPSWKDSGPLKKDAWVRIRAELALHPGNCAQG